MLTKMKKLLSLLQQLLRQFAKEVNIAWFNLMLGTVSFDEEMDCYWQGHAASMEHPAPNNPHVHPVKRDAFNAGVAMERWSLESDETAYQPASLSNAHTGAFDESPHLELQPST